MHPLVILGGSSFLLALILTPLCRNLFRRLGLVDHPDQDRKIHTSPVPNMGGVPIVIAYFASFAIAAAFAEKIQVGALNVTLAIRLLPGLAITAIGRVRHGFVCLDLSRAKSVIITWFYGAV